MCQHGSAPLSFPRRQTCRPVVDSVREPGGRPRQSVAILPTLPQVLLTGRPISAMIRPEGLSDAMHAILANALAALLFIHTVLGCCWHHAHGCDDCKASVAKTAAKHTCCHHHHSDKERGQTPQTPCKCRLECTGTCVYLPTQKTQVDSASSPLPFVTVNM